jgi:hypothetical protein
MHGVARKWGKSVRKYEQARISILIIRVCFLIHVATYFAYITSYIVIETRD